MPSSTGWSSASPATPATACSSPVTGSRRVSALFGNDLSTLPEFPAEIRAPAGTIAGVSAFQVAHLRPRHHDAGRRAERAGGHEPGGAASRARTGWSGAARSSSTSTRSTSATWPRPATPRNPLTDGSLAGYRLVEVPMTSLTKEAGGAARREAPRRRPVEELLRPRARSRGCTPARPSRRSSGSRSASRRRRSVRAPTGPPSWPATTSARRPSCSTTRSRCEPAAAAARRVHQHQRQHRAGVGPGGRRPARRAAAVPRQLPDHAGLRHPPRAVQAQELRRAHASRPKTRSPPSARRSAPPSAATSASPPRAAPVWR